MSKNLTCLFPIDTHCQISNSENKNLQLKFSWRNKKKLFTRYLKMKFFPSIVENVAHTLLLALLWLLAIILICCYHLLNTNSVTFIAWVQYYSFKGIQGCTAGLYDSRVYILNYFIILSFCKGTSSIHILLYPKCFTLSILLIIRK